MKLRLSALLFIFALLNALDYITTIYGVENGIFVEANPISRALLDRGTFDDVKIILISMSCSTGVAAVWLEKRGLMKYSLLWRALTVYIMFVSLLYIIVVVNNFLLLFS